MDSELSEDLAQDAAMRAFAALKPEFDFDNDSFRAWLYTILRNLWYDRCRFNQRHTIESLEELLERADLGSGMSLEDQVVSGITMEIVRLQLDKALERLPEHYQLVETLRLDGYTEGEIAVLLNIPKDRVYRIHYQAKKRLVQLCPHLRQLLDL